MANIKAKIKSIKTMAKAKERNFAIKSRVKTAIKKARLAIVDQAKNKMTKISLAHKEINNSISKGVLHRKTGHRKISRLDKFANKHKSKTQP